VAPLNWRIGFLEKMRPSTKPLGRLTLPIPVADSNWGEKKMETANPKGENLKGTLTQVSKQLEKTEPKKNRSHRLTKVITPLLRVRLRGDYSVFEETGTASSLGQLTFGGHVTIAGARV